MRSTCFLPMPQRVRRIRDGAHGYFIAFSDAEPSGYLPNGRFRPDGASFAEPAWRHEFALEEKEVSRG